MLFAFGLLTIKRGDVNGVVLEIPNETTRRLYYDYIKEAYEETDAFSINLDTYGNLMKGMALKGQWQPLLDYITDRMRESLSLRDLITGEKSIQAFLNVYLGLSNLYMIHTEKELNKGFADIVMEPFRARYEEIKYAYLLEIKYIKAEGKNNKTPPETIRRLKTEGEKQLKNYALDEKFKKNIENTTLIKLLLIFRGHQLEYIGSVD